MQDLVETISSHAVLDLETSSQLVKLFERLSFKVARVLIRQQLRHQHVAHDSGDVLLHSPMVRVSFVPNALRDLVLHVLNDRFPDVLDMSVVSAPGVKPNPFLLVQEGFEESHVRRVGIGVHHALETDVFVQPDAPVYLIFFVNRKLFPKEIVALLVYLLVVLLVGTCVHRTEFAIPYL